MKEHTEQIKADWEDARMAWAVEEARLDDAFASCKRPSRSIPHENLLREIVEAITEAIDCWENPDSPEAFCFAMKHLLIVRDRINSILPERKGRP